MVAKVTGDSGGLALALSGSIPVNGQFQLSDETSFYLNNLVVVTRVRRESDSEMYILPSNIGSAEIEYRTNNAPQGYAIDDLLDFNTTVYNVEYLSRDAQINNLCFGQPVKSAIVNVSVNMADILAHSGFSVGDTVRLFADVYFSYERSDKIQDQK
tara:strand:+ start:5661 stop:6128 length:468 start_codon:yes stop_codon:yes gene_type:complete